MFRRKSGTQKNLKYFTKVGVINNQSKIKLLMQVQNTLKFICTGCYVDIFQKMYQIQNPHFVKFINRSAKRRVEQVF
jgi:hypothetical protein